MFIWLPQFSASIKIVVVHFVEAYAVLIADAD